MGNFVRRLSSFLGLGARQDVALPVMQVPCDDARKPVKGFFSTLTPEQKKMVLSCKVPLAIGDSDGPRIKRSAA